MNAISATTSLPVANQPLIDPANEPASVRNGDQKAKNAYATGVAFENVLVSELAQQMAATVPGLDGSDDGLGGTTDSTGGSTGGVGGSGGLGAYASLLPQTLANSISAGGGTGIAMEIAKSIDPALGAPIKK
jgi:Rod binding domain-containing protein